MGPPAGRAFLSGSLHSEHFKTTISVCYVVLNHGGSSRPMSQTPVAELGYLHPPLYPSRKQHTSRKARFLLSQSIVEAQS